MGHGATHVGAREFNSSSLLLKRSEMLVAINSNQFFRGKVIHLTEVRSEFNFLSRVAVVCMHGYGKHLYAYLI